MNLKIFRKQQQLDHGPKRLLEIIGHTHIRVQSTCCNQFRLFSQDFDRFHQGRSVVLCSGILILSSSSGFRNFYGLYERSKI